jgi:WD40 repeat protein/serine/threonine protein kinase
MTSCIRARHMQRFLDGEMDEAERAEIERHVEACGLCQAELEHLTAADAADWPVLPAPWGDDVSAPIASQGPLRVGDLPRVPGYEVRSELGSGGMSIVYLAYDPRLKREVALKMIRTDRNVRQSDMARFRADAEALARLRHDNIVRIHEVGESNCRPFFTLELAEGGSLEKWLGDKVLPPEAAARLVETLARAVHYAHRHGVIHRDLKPDNVLLSAPREPPEAGASDATTSAVPNLAGVPKITDFGLAKFLDAEGVSACLTMPDLPLGTPSYMAWEQGAGKVDQISIQTDVYGLGAILYKLLTGRAPYEGANNLEIIRKVQSHHEMPIRPSRLRACLPRDLELICLKCLEKEPHRRYATAEQLATELRHFLNNEPLECTRPVGRGERVWLWCRRNPAVAVACSITVLVLIAGTAVSMALSLYTARTAEKLRVALDESTETGRQLAETNYKAADLALSLGLHLCEQGNVSLGVLWLAQSLETAPADAQDLQWAIRTNLAAWGHTLRPLRASLPAPSGVLAVAYSADSKLAVTGAEDGTAQLWDVATGEPFGPPVHHQNRIMAVAFSPDSQTVLTGSWDKTARLWDVRARKAITLAHPDEVWAVAFSRDGKTVLTGGGEPWIAPERPGRGEARLWDAATGKLLHVLPHGDRVYAVAFSGNGRATLTGSSDKSARLWETGSGRLLHTLLHEGRVWAATFSPDDTKVLTCGFDKTARLWDADTGRPIALLPHTAAVMGACFSPDGKVILTWDTGRNAQVWNAETGAPLGAPLPHDSQVLAAAFSPDGKNVLTGCKDRTARLWDHAMGRPLGEPLLNQGEVGVVAFSPDGKTALTASQDQSSRTGQARLWDLTPKYVAAPLRPPGKVSALALSPDGKLAVAGGEGKAWLCETATGNPVGEPLLTGGKVWAVAFSPDGKTVLIAAEDETARRWDLASRRPVGPAFRCQETIFALAFSPDGRMVLTGGPGKAWLWDVIKGEPVGEALPHESDVWAAAFGPDGKTALTGCRDGTAHRWDLTAGKPLGPTLRREKAGPAPPEKRLSAVALSPDGRMALISSGDGCARFWSVATGQPIGPPFLHQNPVLAVAFCAGGKAALTATDKEIRQIGVPAPVDGDVKRIVLWSQALTGTELDLGGAVRGLDWQTLQKRRRHLEELGGPPGRNIRDPGDARIGAGLAPITP